MPPALSIPVLAVAGAIIGSFLATLVVRWPAGRSVLAGRSHCDGCNRPLAPVELVPLLSWTWQRGRCRTCRAPIDPAHPAFELIALAIGGIAAALLPWPLAIAGAALGWALLTLAALDLRHFWLPDAIVWPLGMAGLAMAGLGHAPGLVDVAIGAVAGFASLSLVRLGYRRLKGREGLGAGDPKLLAAIGAWCGWLPLPYVLLAAALLGLAAVLVLRVSGRPIARTTRVPLGALLAVAAWPAWLALQLYSTAIS